MSDLVSDGPIDGASAAPLSRGTLPPPPISLHHSVGKGLRCRFCPFRGHTGAPVCLRSRLFPSRLTQLLVLNSFIFESPT